LCSAERGKPFAGFTCNQRFQTSPNQVGPLLDARELSGTLEQTIVDYQRSSQMHQCGSLIWVGQRFTDPAMTASGREKIVNNRFRE
jgi:hypothetical protein